MLLFSPSLEGSVPSVIPIVSVVVASGTFVQIERWAEKLRAAEIQFLVRWSCDEHRINRHDRGELWVDRAEVDRARFAIRDAPDSDPALLR